MIPKTSEEVKGWLLIKKRVWNLKSLNLSKVVSISSKTLQFLSFQITYKLANGIGDKILQLCLSPWIPLQGIILSSIWQAITQATSKRPHSIVHSGKERGCRRRMIGWLSCPLAKTTPIPIIFPSLVKLSRVRILSLAALQAKKSPNGRQLIFQICLGTSHCSY